MHPRSLLILLMLALFAGAPTLPASEAKPDKTDKVLPLFVEELVAITPGKGKFPASFEMGSSAATAPDNEKPAVKVTFKAPFSIAKYEVTQELYEAVIGRNPARWKGRRNSVEMVNWTEANTFCKKLTDLLREKKLIGADEVIRLPSEAEWEYCCRAGTKTLWSFGENKASLGDYSWFKDNSKGEDPPVGKKKPNAWGLYDMHGYVSEWCADAWHPNYKGAPTDGRAWTEGGEKDRVIRGGSFADPAEEHRSAFRNHKPITTRSDRIGFRCVKSAKPKEGAAGDWPQLLGPHRNGVSDEKDIIDSFPKKGPPVEWQRDVGEGYSSPVIAGHRLILFHRVGDEDVIECLQAATGKQLWKSSYSTDYSDDYGKGNGPRSTPVIAGGKVYTLGANGHLLCLELKSGNALWQKDLHKLYTVKKGFFGVATTPLVEGNLLLVNVGGEGAGIVAFNKDSGKEVWKSTDQDASYSSPIAATVDGVRHVFFFTREGLVGLNPTDGKVRFTKRWRARISASVNAATPVLLGGKYLFLSASYQTGDVLLEIKKDSVSEVWSSRDALASHFSTPVAVGAQLYGFTGRQEAGASLRCIDWKTGKVRWTEGGFGCGSIIAVGGKLFVLSEGGDLVLVEANGAKYTEKSRASVLDGTCRAHLALAHGRLYARDGKKLVCWKVKK